MTVGLLLAAVASLAARRARALSSGGSLAATLVGGAAFAGTGLKGSVALGAFFLTSSVLGRLPRDAPSLPQRRGNERDAVQVLANGGIPALLALRSLDAPPFRREALHCAFGGAVAAAAADTWATEIGSRFGTTPRSLATFRPVTPGTSGGVTAQGLGASAAGAALIAAIMSVRLRHAAAIDYRAAIATVAGGVTGSLVDSLLGATLQEVRYCDRCQRETEAVMHGCGTPTRRVRGAAWCGNDLVNTLAIGVGAAVTTLLAATKKPPFSPRARHRGDPRHVAPRNAAAAHRV